MSFSLLPSCLTQGIGIESEYMLCDATTLAPAPLAATVLSTLGAPSACEVTLGRVCLSNESTNHQIEIKTNGPAAKIAEYLPDFQAAIRSIAEVVGKHNGVVIPSGMHPLLRPNEVTYWQSGSYSAVYDALGRVFDRKSHGWANVQSTHLNFPYSSEEEFRLLHSAIRVVLPILPGLCASSPFVEGQPTGFCDSRLDFYRRRRGPHTAVCPSIIPEVVRSTTEYQEKVLNPAYETMTRACGSTVLCQPWINDRGAIARIDRGTIEIRIIDAQEGPVGDLSVAALVRAVVVDLANRVSLESLEAAETPVLEKILLDSIKYGGASIVNNSRYLSLFNGPNRSQLSCGSLWCLLLGSPSVMALIEPEFTKSSSLIVGSGTLSERILASSRAIGLDGCYRALGESLSANNLFISTR